MRVLIDTHVLIWHLEGDASLTLERSSFIDDPANEPLVSIASLWEISIKQSLGKLKLSHSTAEIIQVLEHSTTSLLQIEPDHIVRVAQLPFHHKDPFDRMILAQAIVEGISIISSDPEFRSYEVDLL